MIKNNVIIYVLFAFYMITFINCNSVEVIWDNSNDVIYYEGKLYYTSDKNDGRNFNDVNSNSDQNLNNGVKNKLPENKPLEKGEHEEELATGAKFWFCCFMILCILINLFSFSSNDFKFYLR